MLNKGPIQKMSNNIIDHLNQEDHRTKPATTHEFQRHGNPATEASHRKLKIHGLDAVSLIGVSYQRRKIRCYLRTAAPRTLFVLNRGWEETHETRQPRGQIHSGDLVQSAPLFVEDTSKTRQARPKNARLLCFRYFKHTYVTREKNCHHTSGQR